MTRLVLIHGRDSGDVDADAVEQRWLDALDAGLDAIGSDLRLTDDDATFVHYGAMLDAASDDLPLPPVTTHAVARPDGYLPLPPVTTHAVARPDGYLPLLAGLDVDRLRFTLDVSREVLAAYGSAPADPPTQDVAAAETVASEGLVGDALARTLAAALATVDRLVPGLSGAVVLLLTHDVYTYLHDAEARAAVDAGVLAALPVDEPAVIVAHSLGAVVAYQVLRSAAAAGRDVPLLVSLGAPLAIRAVQDAVAALAPPGWPEPVDRWVAVRDPRDLLTLHDLTPETFPLDPPGPGVENQHVRNEALLRHAAATVRDGRPAGYAATPEVAALLSGVLGR
ncbi:hypothetical protein [Isoptericola jiangsuensis]|uniref:hypothetical protein n=1 Tax=Isoptericola jiangsuensis TaxID=548579 RepID=UPI00114532E7|nr:hypothetical protein [Isoptericola jiangsuensis]